MKKKTKTTLRIQPHKFVTALEKKESQSKGLKVIQGFIGKAEKTNQVRVYLDAELRRFVDVPKASIEHFEDQRSNAAPHASVLLWVKETASIRHFGNWILSDDPSTMRTGEEGGGDPTTMRTGEESAGLPNPLDPLINPFGTY